MSLFTGTIDRVPGVGESNVSVSVSSTVTDAALAMDTEYFVYALVIDEFSYESDINPSVTVADQAVQYQITGEHAMARTNKVTGVSVTPALGTFMPDLKP